MILCDDCGAPATHYAESDGLLLGHSCDLHEERLYALFGDDPNLEVRHISEPETPK
jgi:hypothetical protein